MTKLSGNGFPVQQEIDALYAMVCEIADKSRGDADETPEVERMIDHFLMRLTAALEDSPLPHQATAG